MEECDGTLYDILFRGLDERTLIISTTRPELLPACVALYGHPQDERYQELYGRSSRVPLFEHDIPIRSSIDVDPRFGTGLMMVCTWGDAEDVKKWRLDRLETKTLFEERGKLTAIAGECAGMTLSAGRQVILKRLAEAGLLRQSRQIRHLVGVHERCGTPIEEDCRAALRVERMELGTEEEFRIYFSCGV